MTRRPLTAPAVRPPQRQRQIAYAAVSALLRYPDDTLIRDLPLLEAAAAALPDAIGGPLRPLISHLAGSPLLSLQAAYVATFDLRRRNCLYLSYYLNGDTRRRGEALWRFQEVYRKAGFRPAGSELPDYLPMLLELAASGGEAAADGLLSEHRRGIRLLLSALEASQSPYAGAIRALEAVLPPAGPRLITEAARLAREGPPAELVGLDAPGTLAPYRARGGARNGGQPS
jgi:nitrate reductase delta subunit